MMRKKLLCLFCIMLVSLCLGVVGCASSSPSGSFPLDYVKRVDERTIAYKIIPRCVCNKKKDCDKCRSDTRQIDIADLYISFYGIRNVHMGEKEDIRLDKFEGVVTIPDIVFDSGTLWFNFYCYDQSGREYWANPMPKSGLEGRVKVWSGKEGSCLKLLSPDQ